ncbi:type II toxin-antitoxin system VapC family toxin [Salinisphaera sp.]|uniref:type II toxin-antitoxin system VapC family toxin n=1 Tax=Salinisphaera sp. TaxID=1914330 RepID=UPI002D78C5EC|nr:type II toxin-antitoxin system VapC family toxin [Salinisphaera sp.]HET7315477.1 type II toxin-antitoxin system VapC family toxin [Salinisphaera sp.]
MVVVDASAILEALLCTARADAAQQWLDERQTLHAPDLIDIEIAQALRRYHLRGELGARRGAQALDDLAAFGIKHYPHAPLLRRVWQLRANISAYDAAYVALAEALDAPLLTSDARLANAPGHQAVIHCLT